MNLVRLDIHHCRVITHASLLPDPALNLITGENASGKTSLLEAIYLLFSGRSFRTARLGQLIQKGQSSLQLIGSYVDLSSRKHVLGLEREPKSTKVHLDGVSLTTSSQKQSLTPVHIINPETHLLLDYGPKFRRQFLDWGVFHVEHDYLELWKAYHRVLRQRNTLLRNKASDAQILAWDRPLVEQAVMLDTSRKNYMSMLRIKFDITARNLLDDIPTLGFYSGWQTDLSLADTLRLQFQSDKTRGFTQYGCHRADIQLTTPAGGGISHFSRGQQKLLVTAMRIAHLRVLQEVTGEPGILLIDDLPSELDKNRRRRLLETLAGLSAQIFITATDSELLDLSGWSEKKMFHVEHGKICEVL